MIYPLSNGSYNNFRINSSTTHTGKPKQGARFYQISVVLTKALSLSRVLRQKLYLGTMFGSLMRKLVINARLMSQGLFVLSSHCLLHLCNRSWTMINFMSISISLPFRDTIIQVTVAWSTKTDTLPSCPELMMSSIQQDIDFRQVKWNKRWCFIRKSQRPLW